MLICTHYLRRSLCCMEFLNHAKLIASDHEYVQITFLYSGCVAKLINNNFTRNYNLTKGNYVALNNSLFSMNWYNHSSLCKNKRDK